MSLEIEIEKASQDIVKDGYEMSIGELLNLYRDDELVIDPEFQRYFRWDVTCLLYTSPSPRDQRGSRMPSSA